MYSRIVNISSLWYIQNKVHDILQVNIMSLYKYCVIIFLAETMTQQSQCRLQRRIPPNAFHYTTHHLMYLPTSITTSKYTLDTLHRWVKHIFQNNKCGNLSQFGIYHFAIS